MWVRHCTELSNGGWCICHQVSNVWVLGWAWNLECGILHWLYKLCTGICIGYGHIGTVGLPGICASVSLFGWVWGGGEVVLHCPMSSCSMSYICKTIPPKEICPSQKQMQGKYIRFCFMEQEICTLGCQFDAMVVVAQMWCCHTWCNGAACTCLPTWQLIGL